jgi:hypothetical protein
MLSQVCKDQKNEGDETPISGCTDQIAFETSHSDVTVAELVILIPLRQQI